VALAATDSEDGFFTSALGQEGFALAPGGGAAQTVLIVSADAGASGPLVNETAVLVSVAGVEYARAMVTTRLMYVEFTRSVEGSGVSDHKVPPSTRVKMYVGVTSATALNHAVLTDFIPADWKVVGRGGGSLIEVGANTQKLEWSLGDLTAGETVTKMYTMVSPNSSQVQTPYSFQSALTGNDYQFQSESWPILLAHPLTVAKFRIAWDSSLDQMAYVSGIDMEGGDIPRFQAFRVRFRVRNHENVTVTWQPSIQWGSSQNGSFQPLPPRDSVNGEPFYVRPVRTVSDGESIIPVYFGLGSDSNAPQEGYVFTEQNPGPMLTMNSRSYTEIEFSVRATIDAEYNMKYYFRLTDGDRLLPGKVAHIKTGDRPPVVLTQPQYPGTDPGDSGGGDTSSTSRGPGMQSLAGGGTQSLNPHGPYDTVTDACARCHRSKTGQTQHLLPTSSPQSQLCFLCHDGTGSSYDIRGQYTDGNVPANDSNSSAFYSHPAMVATTHTSAKDDEFQGVQNRHTECGDCHNAHNANGLLASGTASGYTVSGALLSLSGIGVTNGGAGSTPTFNWQSTATYEYEVCFKCHSGYTNLLSYAKESYQKHDKGAEFNPNNPSFHPVEAVGKNTTTKMGNNLAGSSPYKLWNFATSDTVRCVHCHGDYRQANPSSPPSGNARLASHTSQYRSLLMNNLRDRNLKPKGEAYNATDFALCFQCHAEAPYVDHSGDNRDDTNFRLHGYHLTKIEEEDGGNLSLDIDTIGAGQGNALCGECHYRVHGQDTSARGNPTGTRLVNFAPNVTGSSMSGRFKWDSGQRRCYVTCHGKDHMGKGY